MPTPVRFTSGVTTDPVWGPLGQYGMRNPFFYHEVEDDFDSSLGVTGAWTQTKTGNGTIAHTAGDGGLGLFTTNSSTPAAGDVCSIQLPAASFAFAAGKKFFFLTRLKLSSAANNGLLCGLIQTTATPFTVTDGLYFLKATGSASNLILRSTVSSVNTDLTIPTSAYTLADATNIDLGFYYDGKTGVYATVGSQLVGYIPQSGVGSLTPPVKSPNAFFAPTLTTANLNLTLALQSGTASSKTMTADFILAAKER